MPQRFKIGIDCDGVLANFTGAAREFFLSRFGIDTTSIIQTDWDFECLGVTTEQNNEFYNYSKNVPNWWRTLRPIAGGESLWSLSKDHTLFFITNRYQTLYGASTEIQTAKWLRDIYTIEFPTVIVTAAKGPIAAALELDYFIDDKPENCFEVEYHSPLCQTYIMNADYNSQFVAIPRVQTFDEFTKIVEAANG